MDTSESIIEELEVDTKYGRKLTPANFFDNEESILMAPNLEQTSERTENFAGPMGNVNSLIRKIKPTNLEFSNKKGKSDYDAVKKPVRSILKVKQRITSRSRKCRRRAKR